MVDIEELKRVMVVRGVTNEKLSEELNIDPSTLYRRLKNKGSKFNIEEAQKIKEVLKLSDKAAIKIFFKKWLALLRVLWLMQVYKGSVIHD